MTNIDNKIHFKIGLKIKLERNKRNLSQEKLAELADISKTHVGAIERGTSIPTIDVLNQIAIALDMELHDLVNVSKFEL